MYFVQNPRKWALFWVFWLFALIILQSATDFKVAKAEVDPNPPLYQDPPPNNFKSNLTNLPTVAPYPQKIGFAAHPWWLDIFLDEFIWYYKDLKVSTIRLPFEWKVIEPKPGEYDWRREDRLLTRLNDEGFTIIADFVTVPVWASNNPAECASLDVLCGIKKSPDTLNRLDKMAEASVKRYPFIRHWEFWNEPERWQNVGGKDISDYAPFLRVFYDGAKRADKTILVAACSEVGPAYIDWLYRYSDSVWGNNRPWDAIAYHPYNQDGLIDPVTRRKMSLRKERIDQLYNVMKDFGDGNKPIWITEIGWGGKPEDQALYLVDALRFLDSRPFVTIVNLHMLHDWEQEDFGVLRIEPDILWKRPLEKGDKFVPKQPYYDALKNYVKRKLPSQPAFGGDVLVFPETQHTVRDAFRKAWLQGGLSLYGYPKTGQFYERNPIDNKYYLVQYFERVRMEYHPEFAGTNNEVLFGLLGSQILIERKWLDERGVPMAGAALPPSFPIPAVLPADAQYFKETEHTVSGLFLQAWKQNGGLAVLGYPKTTVFEEKSADDGKTYPVQYFERARLELHAANSTQPALILFGLLGNDRLRLQGRLDNNNAPLLENYYNPTLPEFTLDK